MTLVFLDTVGLLALWDEDDQWHDAASAAWDELKAARTRLCTSSYVLGECANALARTRFRSAVDDLRQALEVRHGVLHPTRDVWQEAWGAYRRGSAAKAGLVDQLSFVIMERMAITEVFTNDRHFVAAGFHTLF